MGTVPDPHTWTHKEELYFREMKTYVEDPVSFLMNPPMIRLRKITPVTVGNGLTIALSWDFPEVETENFWDSTLPTRLKPSTPGWYIGQVGFSFAANINGQREMNVRKNNAATDRVLRVHHDAYPNSGWTVVNRGNVFLESFNGTTDYIEVLVHQNSGGNLDTLADTIERQCDISLRWFAPL
jgi:hypothetical protein